eukprot:m.39337 g.39337  ORF g.39337 m.39337 type:complete len:191 (+) comp9538_c0_seq2:45-617(+)
MSSGKRLVIGLTGRNAAGKGAASEILKEQYGLKYLSCSQFIREYLAQESIEESRESLFHAGNKLRELYGAGALGHRAAARILESDPTQGFVVDSIRCGPEVEELKKIPEFRLFELRANESVRYERLKSRARTGDSKTFEEFKENERRETTSSDPSKQQLHVVAQMADAVIQNDGTVEELQASLETEIKKL